MDRLRLRPGDEQVFAGSGLSSPTNPTQAVRNGADVVLAEPSSAKKAAVAPRPQVSNLQNVRSDARAKPSAVSRGKSHPLTLPSTRVHVRPCASRYRSANRLMDWSQFLRPNRGRACVPSGFSNQLTDCHMPNLIPKTSYKERNRRRRRTTPPRICGASRSSDALPHVERLNEPHAGRPAGEHGLAREWVDAAGDWRGSIGGGGSGC